MAEEQEAAQQVDEEEEEEEEEAVISLSDDDQDDDGLPEPDPDALTRNFNLRFSLLAKCRSFLFNVLVSWLSVDVFYLTF